MNLEHPAIKVFCGSLQLYRSGSLVHDRITSVCGARARGDAAHRSHLAADRGGEVVIPCGGAGPDELGEGAGLG